MLTKLKFESLKYPSKSFWIKNQKFLRFCLSSELLVKRNFQLILQSDFQSPNHVIIENVARFSAFHLWYTLILHITAHTEINKDALYWGHNTSLKGLSMFQCSKRCFGTIQWTKCKRIHTTFGSRVLFSRRLENMMEHGSNIRKHPSFVALLKFFSQGIFHNQTSDHRLYAAHIK